MLVGRTIRKVLIGEEKTVLAFELAPEACDQKHEDCVEHPELGLACAVARGQVDRMAFYTDGDCCSQSWIEHLQNADSLIGATVTSAEDIEMGDVSDTYGPDNEAPQEHVQAYGVKVHALGRPPLEFEFRNASNGYYGGSIEHTTLDDKRWAALSELREDF